jgi:hypothetical protein
MKNEEHGRKISSDQVGSVDIQLEHVERPAVFHVKHVRYSRGHREAGRASSENQGFAGNTTGEDIFFRTKNWGILHSLQNRPSSMLFFGWNTSVPVTEVLVFHRFSNNMFATSCKWLPRAQTWSRSVMPHPFSAQVSSTAAATMAAVRIAGADSDETMAS